MHISRSTSRFFFRRRRATWGGIDRRKHHVFAPAFVGVDVCARMAPSESSLAGNHGSAPRNDAAIHCFIFRISRVLGRPFCGLALFVLLTTALFEASGTMSSIYQPFGSGPAVKQWAAC